MGAVNYKIAGVYLLSRPRQTIVAILGVTFGISMYIFMNSFMSGVNQTQNDLAFSSIAHIRIYNDGPSNHTNLLKGFYPDNTLLNIRHSRLIQYTEGIKNSREITQLVQSSKEVTGVTPQVNLNVFFRNGDNKVNGTLSGVDIAGEDKVFKISTYMVSGNWTELQYRPDGIILGLDLAHQLSLNLEDNINILTSDGVTKNYKVIGLFQTNVKNVDKAKAYLNIVSTRQLLSKNQDYVTDIQINVKDYEKTAALTAKLARVVPFKVESWQISNQQLEAGSALRDIIAMAVSLTILLVAGFGIYNIMNMTINEKIREIAILKAMGFSGKDVTIIFLIQAIAIGIIGGMVGILLGYLVSFWVNHIPFKIGGLNHLPMAYQFTDYFLAFVFGLITTLLAGFLPARKASKVDPVLIIRG
jgi:lipoprotein-releasing system permease protein